jgi:DNA-directed RNA polymerase alpha subunit
MSEKTRQELGPHSDNQSLSLDDVPLNALDLSTRAYNRLRRAGYHTVAEIASLTDEQFLSIRQVGIIVLGEIREKLTVYLDRHPLSEPSRPSESLHTTQVHLSRNTLIGVLRLSIDSYNALWRDGVATIGQLAQMSSEQILSIQGVNEKSLAEIEGKLKAYLDERPPLAPELTASTEPESLPPPDLAAPPFVSQAFVPGTEPIKILGLSIRSHNALMRDGVATISQLAQMSAEQILSVRNVGEKSLTEIEESP